MPFLRVRCFQMQIDHMTERGASVRMSLDEFNIKGSEGALVLTSRYLTIKLFHHSWVG